MKKFNFIWVLGILMLGVSCSEDFLDKGAEDDISKEQIQDLANSSPEAALTLAAGAEAGNYFFLNDFSTAGHGNIHDEFGLMAFNLGLDLMSNDMLMTQSHWFINYYNYTGRTEPSIRTDAIWKFYYRAIKNMNEGLLFVPSDVVGNELRFIRGRMLAMRGLCYFNLVRLYSNGAAGIPVVTDTELKLGRVPTDEVKAQILADLTEAHDLLNGYTRTTKTSIDKAVVAGLLARYNLEYGNYAQAAAFAAEARAGYAPMSSDALFDGFNKIGNSEWMWGADINTQTSTVYASFFSHIGNLNAGYAGLLQIYKNIDRRIYDAIPNTDSRKSWFVDEGNQFGLPKYANIKFVDDTNFEGDYVFMRGAEMYLIEAEAKALGGDDAGARQALFDLVSTRDASYTLSSNSGAALLNEIRLHRKIELWGEGFAFYDMKRWNNPLERDYAGTNHISLGLFNYPAGSPKFIFQFPASEMNTNPEITEQNPL